jgi:small subunit ribosomal protein S4
MVNGQLVNIPSYHVQVGDIVSIRERSRSLEVVSSSLDRSNHSKYEWLEWNSESRSGRYLQDPLRDQIPENIKEQLIVELYSK